MNPASVISKGFAGGFPLGFPRGFPKGVLEVSRKGFKELPDRAFHRAFPLGFPFGVSLGSSQRYLGGGVLRGSEELPYSS